MLILGLLAMYFDAAVVFITSSSLLLSHTFHLSKLCFFGLLVRLKILPEHGIESGVLQVLPLEPQWPQVQQQVQLLEHKHE